MFTAGKNHQPVWRDGLSTSLTYVFLAVKEQHTTYNAVCYGNGKIKFYPNIETFGITRKQLEELGAEDYLSHKHDAGYERWVLPRQKIEPVLQLLRGQRGMVVAPEPPAVEQAIETGKNRQGGEHPRGSRVPSKDSLVELSVRRAQSIAPKEAVAA